MIKKISRNKTRQKRHLRIRKHISGTTSVPRLVVFRSNLHIYAQLIDDTQRCTLVSAASDEKALKLERGSNTKAAYLVGKTIAEKALQKDIKHVVFDRGGYLYHGRVKALADGARDAGLEF